MDVIENCELIICCVCCTSSSDEYLNIKENHLNFQNSLITFEFIIKDLLGSIDIDEDDEKPRQICSLCKTKILEFFIWKKNNEETRKIHQFKELLKMTNFNPMDLENNDTLGNLESNDDIFAELNNEDCIEDKVIEIPITKKTNRKRKACPEKWDRNKRKCAKNLGLSYVTKCGKVIEAKQMKKNCGSCRMNCTQRITEEVRLKNFNQFYKLGDLEKQRKFIVKHTKVFDKKSSSESRKILRMFYLDDFNDDNGMIQVCKTMFLNTLVVSSQTIATIQNKITKEGKVDDLRGKYTRRKTSILEATTTLPFFLISLK